MKKDNLFKKVRRKTFDRLFKKKLPPMPSPEERRTEAENRIQKALADRGISCDIGGRILDVTFFDLDNDNKKTKGIAAVTEKMLVSLQDEKITVVELSRVKNIYLRSEFGVFAGEAVTQEGETFVIGRVSAKDGKRISGFFKRAELF